MKAKEYFENLPEGWSLNLEYDNYKKLTNAIYDACIAFYGETVVIATSSKTANDSSVIAAFVEQHKKRKAFAKLVNAELEQGWVSPSAFKNLLKHKHPLTFNKFADKLL